MKISLQFIVLKLLLLGLLSLLLSPSLQAAIASQTIQQTVPQITQNSTNSVENAIQEKNADEDEEDTEVLIRGAIEDVNADSRFLIYYGDDYYLKDAQGQPLLGQDKRWILNQDTMNKLIKFDVVVLQPNQAHCTPEVVDYLQDHGVDYVLGYISIGEQSAPVAEKGDGSGPLRYDAKSQSLQASHLGLASFYMDVDTQKLYNNPATQQRSVVNSIPKVPDNQPDINPQFAGYMIYPNAAWRSYIKTMRIGQPNAQAGLDQLISDPDDALELTQKRDQNFGFDGFFLDTIDTAGPYDGLGWYPWALEAMRDTVKFISDTYPNKVVFANRGSFYFQAGLKSPVTQQYPIDFTIRPYVNAFLFESYLYDSEPKFDGINQQSEYYYDNRYNQMPKIIAEAQRDDGFSLFILEYDSGRSKSVDNFMTRIINEDIALWGATTYIADNGRLNSINTTLLPYLPHSNSATKPQWTSTAYQYIGEKLPTNLLTRTGVNHIRAGASNDEVIVSWDVAATQYQPVSYRLYWSTIADIETADSMDINIESLQSTDHYRHEPSLYAPYQVRLKDLDTGTYYFWMVAKDARGNLTENPIMRHFSINPAVDISSQNSVNNISGHRFRFAESRPKRVNKKPLSQ